MGPKKKAKKDGIVYTERGIGYTKSKLEAMNEKDFRALGGKSNNCKMYVEEEYKDEKFGEKQVTVCFICFVFNSSSLLTIVFKGWCKKCKQKQKCIVALDNKLVGEQLWEEYLLENEITFRNQQQRDEEKQRRYSHRRKDSSSQSNSSQNTSSQSSPPSSQLSSPQPSSSRSTPTRQSGSTTTTTTTTITARSAAPSQAQASVSHTGMIIMFKSTEK